jgi:hypothetical protein
MRTMRTTMPSGKLTSALQCLTRYPTLFTNTNSPKATQLQPLNVLALTTSWGPVWVSLSKFTETCVIHSQTSASNRSPTKFLTHARIISLQQAPALLSATPGVSLRISPTEPLCQPAASKHPPVFSRPAIKQSQPTTAITASSSHSTADSHNSFEFSIELMHTATPHQGHR